jgi:DNA-binding GntR family transcriptional regulator
LNAADFAYQFIKSKILSQEYGPALQLKEVHIANKLGLTRTPIREAMIKLELEGLVRIYNNKGAFVSQISEKEIEDLFEVREALETKAAYLAIRRANRDELDNIRQALEAREKFITRGILKNYLLSELDFHYGMLKLCKNERLIGIWENLHTQLCLARFRSSMIDKRYLSAHKEHKQILLYIHKGDYEKTKQLLKAHLLKAKENLLLHYAPNDE